MQYKDTVKIKITPDIHRIFYELSGDYNELHTNSIAARRMIFGGAVVHGIHLLLQAFENMPRIDVENLGFSTLKAVFVKPVFIDEEIEICYSVNESSGNIKITSNHSVKLEIDVTFTTNHNFNDHLVIDALPIKAEPIDVAEGEIIEQQGDIELFYKIDFGHRIFPRITKHFNKFCLASLLGTTRIVGQLCPGKNSVYSELEMIEENSNINDNKMHYKAIKYDKRFNLAKINVNASCLSGKISAFLRPEAAKQEKYADIKKHVKSGEFSGQRALIIGGSRGIGEVTAKILCAGNAETVITYNNGKQDADRIVDEISSQDGKISCMKLNVLEDSLEEVLNCINKPTHIYYFSTPHIGTSTSKFIDREKLIEFMDFFVIGYQKLFEIAYNEELKGVFYPSTEFLDNISDNFIEYSIAKSAGEAMCKQLQMQYKKTTIYAPRLPKMKTDQTISLFKSSYSETFQTMITEIRKFNEQLI
jgi:hypothetical protein